MRFAWLTFGILLMALGVSYFWQHRPQPGGPALPAVSLVATGYRLPAPGVTLDSSAQRSLAHPIADSLVRFALAQRGAAYCYAGTSPATGFDCSGFVHYVFGHFGYSMPHSTALLIGVGRPVARSEAQPGDIVVFTGTAAGSTTPGHAGIVISARGEVPLRFVHSSSARRESGVKVSQVENSGYETRFLGVRRVL